MATKFELYKDKAAEWRWRLKHSNGNIIAASSEGYSSISKQKTAYEIVKASGTSPVEEV